MVFATQSVALKCEFDLFSWLFFYHLVSIVSGAFTLRNQRGSNAILFMAFEYITVMVFLFVHGSTARDLSKSLSYAC